MDVQKLQRIENCLAMLHCLEAREPISRKQISEETGLSLMTVGKLCALLEEAELISERKEDKSESGRRASLCSASPSLACCVINCTDSTYTLTMYTPSGKTCVSLMHSFAEDIIFEDRFFQFADRMSEMLQRIAHVPPASVCLISEGSYEGGTLTLPNGQRANVLRAVGKIFPVKRIRIYTPAACAAAALERSCGSECVAAVIGKQLSFALPRGAELPYSSSSVYPNKLRVDGVSLGERLRMMGTPDKECVYSFLSALDAFFPERHISLFPLAEANGALTCGELCRYAVENADLQKKCSTRTDPLGDMSDGARLMLLSEILKKHV
ncbi:MAG: MarR family transcriptional regulator [Ruminococcaceae bacterium]|nr:MarR family transcriptional regulator [Oscillospiraceae bacterium]